MYLKQHSSSSYCRAATSWVSKKPYIYLLSRTRSLFLCRVEGLQRGRPHYCGSIIVSSSVILCRPTNNYSLPFISLPFTRSNRNINHGAFSIPFLAWRLTHWCVYIIIFRSRHISNTLTPIYAFRWSFSTLTIIILFLLLHCTPKRYQLNTYPWGVFNREKIKNVPNWDVFEKTSILTKVRVSVDSHGLGDHGLGTGLVVRGAAVVKSARTGY